MMDKNLALIQELGQALGNTLRSRPLLESGIEMPESLVKQCVTDMTTILTDINYRMREIDPRYCAIVIRGALNRDLEMFIEKIDGAYPFSPSEAVEYFRAYLHYLFHQATVCLCGYGGFGDFDDPLVQAIYEAYPGMPALYEDDRKENCKIIQTYLQRTNQNDLFFCGDIEMIASSGI